MRNIAKEFVNSVERILMNGIMVREEKSEGTLGIVDSCIYTGNKLVTKSRFKNKLLLDGSVYLSEKGLGRRSNFNRGSIDKLLNVVGASAVVLNNTNLQQEAIVGIMAGIGGSGSTQGTIYPVQTHKKTVPQYIPFRMVPVANDLTGAERNKYFLRVVDGAYVKYYGKKFEVTDTKVLYENGTEVPLNVDTLENPDVINAFNEYKIDIDTKDFREYFISLNGDSLLCHINTIGLVSGFSELDAQSNVEFRNVRGITAANMSRNPLENPLSTIGFTYQHIMR